MINTPENNYRQLLQIRNHMFMSLSLADDLLDMQLQSMDRNRFQQDAYGQIRGIGADVSVENQGIDFRNRILSRLPFRERGLKFDYQDIERAFKELLAEEITAQGGDPAILNDLSTLLDTELSGIIPSGHALAALFMEPLAFGLMFKGLVQETMERLNTPGLANLVDKEVVKAHPLRDEETAPERDMLSEKSEEKDTEKASPVKAEPEAVFEAPEEEKEVQDIPAEDKPHRKAQRSSRPMTR